MSAGYGRIAFTKAVQDEQEHHGSRRFYARHQARAEQAGGPDRLTSEIRDYLAERDSFYLASVSETGWPYVQFRGGPAGFLTVLAQDTVGWADFRGNLQYISTGNLRSDDRVALIVMDYPNRQRLKIYGHATIHEADKVPELVAQLTPQRYDAVIERAVLIQVEAFDWNCQQHITPRYTLDEIHRQTSAMRHRLAAAEAENAELRHLLEATPVSSDSRDSEAP
jgi:predicted pyridoxine 5'-phosphate oxidase superfamily flavin-nucleotide-binding protein